MPKTVMTTPENAVKNAILNFLKDNGIYHWRHNVGGFKRNNRFIKFGATGQSDIMGVLFDGKFLAIECKDVGEIPTPAQIDFLDHMNSLNAIVILAYSVEDVRTRLFELGYIR